jgi:hypothetical protein
MQLKVGVSVPMAPLYCEFGSMVLDVLVRLGFDAILVRAGDRGALEVDILLLIGEEAHFADYAPLLSRRTRRRPTTALWQLEPCPPPEFASGVEPQGLRSAKLARAALRLVDAPKPVKKLLKAMLPLLAQTGVVRTCAAKLLSNLERDMGKSLPPAWGDLDALSCFYMMRACAWSAGNGADRWLDAVFTSTIPQQQFLLSRGVPAHFAPIGYHPAMGSNLARRRDIDVVFLGNVRNRRREAILREIQRSLAAKGVRLVTIEGGCYGAQRSSLLNRARISLNLVNYRWDLPALRFLLSIGCGALVISEPLGDTTPYQAGEHFVQADIADLPEAICYYVEREREREAIVRTAAAFLLQECTLHHTLARLMGTCTAARAPAAAASCGGHRGSQTPSPAGE